MEKNYPLITDRRLMNGLFALLGSTAFAVLLVLAKTALWPFFR